MKFLVLWNVKLGHDCEAGTRFHIPEDPNKYLRKLKTNISKCMK
jgi:hypothetical protein